MPVRSLPAQPSLEHLRYQAKDLIREHGIRTLSTAQRLREFHPKFHAATDHEIFAAKLPLNDAQLAIAREYGFPSWSRLKHHVEDPDALAKLRRPHHERIEDPMFRRAVELIDAGDAESLRSLLRAHPELVRQRVTFEGGNYFHTAALLEFVAENPVRRGKLPANIVDVARVILDADPDAASREHALMLIATGSVPRQGGVQSALIDLLCDAGNDPGTATHAAALHGELDALRALLRRGARVDLEIAAALGRVEDFARLLPSSTATQRHLALALASQYGHIEIVRLLLDAGEDPNRYNPIGGHAHGTPLHQAAAGGFEEMARLLVERGARLDIKDVLWHATPAEWAAHEGEVEVERYLREMEANIAAKAGSFAERHRSG